MKYYILKQIYHQGIKQSYGLSDQTVTYYALDVKDIISPMNGTYKDLLEQDKFLWLELNTDGIKERVNLGKIYFKTDNIIEFAEKITDLEEDRRKIVCLELK